jgi:hypothetical protein
MAFVCIADGILAGVIAVSSNPDAEKLIQELVFISQGEVTLDEKRVWRLFA